MKKLIFATIVILSIGLAMTVVGAVLLGITSLTEACATFNISILANTLRDIGIITAALSGIVLTGLGVATAVRCDCEKK